MPARPVIDYVLNGLAAAPLVQARLLKDCTAWDECFNPDRFTLREMIAHLADWEEIWLTRFERFVTENHPYLPSIDEGQIAIDRNYGSQDPDLNIRRYNEGRRALLQMLRGLPDESWARTGHREFVGDINLFELAAIITGHDGYHLNQTLAYLSE